MNITKRNIPTNQNEMEFIIPKVDLAFLGVSSLKILSNKIKLINPKVVVVFFFGSKWPQNSSKRNEAHDSKSQHGLSFTTFSNSQNSSKCNESHNSKSRCGVFFIIKLPQNSSKHNEGHGI